MNIVITGASRGIGFEIARLFAAAGNNNIIAISRNEDGLKKLKNACIRENIEAHLYPFVYDLENISETRDELKSFITQHFDRIDILVNNAGVLINKSFEALKYNDFAKSFQVNVIAAAEMIQSCLPFMRKSEAAHTINISSMGGYQGSAKFPGLLAYSASKAALANLTECLAEEYKDSKLRFNCLCLGAVQTEMLNEAFPGYQAPLNAIEMAEYIVAFALNHGKYFNGKIIPVSVSTP